MKGEIMRNEYDFSKGERGKFYDPDATMNLPVYLDADVFEFFSKRAKAKGVELGSLVNDVLKKDMKPGSGL